MNLSPKPPLQWFETRLLTALCVISFAGVGALVGFYVGNVNYGKVIGFAIGFFVAFYLVFSPSLEQTNEK